MLRTVNHNDLIFYRLRNDIYSQLSNPLKTEFDGLINDITYILTSDKNFHILSTSFLSQLFNLRIKTIKWLSRNENFDYLKTFNNTAKKIEERDVDERLQILKENVLFALRCNRRVIESLSESSENMALDLTSLPDINYQQFLSSLAFVMPDDEMAQKIVDWTTLSLKLEFGILAADMIKRGDIEVSETIIDELSFLIADTAQGYFALAIEFGLIRKKSVERQPSIFSFDEEFIREQHTLADIGIQEWGSTFLD